MALPRPASFRCLAFRNAFARAGRRLGASLLLCTLALGLAACDGSDPIDRDAPGDVAGVYRFTTLRFQPDGRGIATANVLDTLRQDITALRLSSNGAFFIDYQFTGGTFFSLRGTFQVTESSVSLDGAGNDQADYQRLLLDPDLLLRRTAPGVLEASLIRRVNLQAYAPERYAGLTSVPGTLQIRLERQ